MSVDKSRYKIGHMSSRVSKLDVSGKMHSSSVRLQKQVHGVAPFQCICVWRECSHLQLASFLLFSPLPARSLSPEFTGPGTCRPRTVFFSVYRFLECGACGGCAHVLDGHILRRSFSSASKCGHCRRGAQVMFGKPLDF